MKTKDEKIKETLSLLAIPLTVFIVSFLFLSGILMGYGLFPILFLTILITLYMLALICFPLIQVWHD